MKSKLQFDIRKHWLQNDIRRIPLLALLSLLILPSMAQINTYQKNIYITGQITNSATGAPIPDHQVYIQSDSALNNGFTYYATAVTDVNGFYWDTIVTTSGDGIINFYTYDFNEFKVELDRYYRFIWENEYVMIADMSLYDPNTTNELQANFEAQTDTLEDNPLKIIFVDKSIGQSIKSWRWEFGDGGISQEKDPVHFYEKPGLYMVKLTISALPSGFEHYLQSTIIKQVYVGYDIYYHMGGHVFSDYFPIDRGLAYLYIYDNDNNLIPLDTTQIDPILGYYYFYHLLPGKYLTKTRLLPESIHYGKFMPTYYGNVYDWDKADPIILEDNDWELDISLLHSTGDFTGNGKIIGQISYDTNRTIMTIIPASEIEILLLNDNAFYLTCGTSDDEGNFIFSDLAYGTYQLFPDVAGISNTPMFVTISEEKPLAGNVNLFIHPGEITLAIQEAESDFLEKAFLVYPNPAKDQAKIRVEMKRASQLAVTITDIQGKEVFYQDNTFNSGINELLIDLKQFPAGYYQVLLIPQDNKIISGKLLKFN